MRRWGGGAGEVRRWEEEGAPGARIEDGLGEAALVQRVYVPGGPLARRPGVELKRRRQRVDGGGRSRREGLHLRRASADSRVSAGGEGRRAVCLASNRAVSGAIAPVLLSMLVRAVRPRDGRACSWARERISALLDGARDCAALGASSTVQAGALSAGWRRGGDDGDGHVFGFNESE